MAVRSLKTKLEISGADEYKRAVGEINSRISVMNAELKKATAEFKGNENSVEAVTKKKRKKRKKKKRKRKKR